MVGAVVVGAVGSSAFRGSGGAKAIRRRVIIVSLIVGLAAGCGGSPQGRLFTL